MKTEKCWCNICGEEIVDDEIFNSSDWSRFDVLDCMDWCFIPFQESMGKLGDTKFFAPRNKYHACETCRKDIVKIEDELSAIYHDRLAFIKEMLTQKAKEKTAKLFKDIKND